MLVLGWSSVYLYASSSENDRKMKKIMISSDLLGLPWQHEIFGRDFKQVFLNNVLPFIVSKNPKMIQTFTFSKNSEAKNGPYRPLSFDFAVK